MSTQSPTMGLHYRLDRAHRNRPNPHPVVHQLLRDSGSARSGAYDHPLDRDRMCWSLSSIRAIQLHLQRRLPCTSASGSMITTLWGR